MARTPTSKRKAAKPAPKLHGERQPFSFMLPFALVAEIDAIASEESRSRVRMVEVILREYVQTYRHRAVA